MLNVRILVVLPLAQSDLTIWVRAILVSMVDLNFSPPNWLKWMKSLLVAMNWILSAMTFSMSFPRVFKRTMGWNAFSWLYDILLGLGIIIIDESLKKFGQCPKSKHELAMLMMLMRQSSWLMIDLRWCHVSLLGPGADKLLHLLITCLNSSLEKEYYCKVGLQSISLSMFRSTYWLRVVLNVLWRVSQRLSGDRHGWLLYLMALMAGSLHLLIQFISFQGSQLLLATSWILVSKKSLLTFLTTFLKFFQFSRLLVNL